MEKKSDTHTILLAEESGEPPAEIMETVNCYNNTRLCTTHDLVTGGFCTDVAVVVVVFTKYSSGNREILLSARKNFPRANILVIQNTQSGKNDTAGIHKEAVEQGADVFLEYPVQAELLKPYLERFLSSEADIPGTCNNTDRKEHVLLASREIFSQLEMRNLLRKCVERTVTITAADTGVISVITPVGGIVSECLSDGSWTNREDISPDCPLNTEGITDYIHSEQKTEPFHLLSDRYESFLNTPLVDREGNIIAILEIGKHEGYFYHDSDMEVLEELASITSLVLENINILNYTRSKHEASRFYEKSFRHLVENSPFSIMFVQHNKIKFVNNTTVRDLGYTKNELLDRNIIDIISNPDIEEFIDSVKKALSSGNSVKLTTGLKSKNGGVITYEIEINSMLYEERHSVQLVARELGPETGISQETTRLAAAVNSLNSAVTITDMNRKIIYINPAHKKCFGYEPGELLGMESNILFPFDDPSGVSKKIYDAIQILGWEGERIGVRKNGQVFPVYEKISVVKDKNGKSVGIVSVLDEITERKKLEQALKESEERYRTLVDTANTAIIAVNEKGKITYVNPAAEKLFEYRHDELIDEDVTVLMPEKYKQLFRDKVSDSAESGFSGYLENTVEFTGLKKSGVEVPLEISISKCRIEGTRIYTAIIMDITERKNLQEQLIQSAKLAAIGELISGVTHEVNNPLAIVMGYAEMILQEPEIDEDMKQYVGIIFKESERARKVIQNLLSFARQHNPEKEKISVNELLNNTLLLAEYDIKKNNITVKKNYDQNLPSIMADPNQLQQVFLNLLINAQHAVSEKNGNGEILLETSLIEGNSSENETRVMITIRDNGKGIPDNILNRIFDPFFTTKPVNKGTGLGLSVSHGIIKEHGGNIYAENNPGEGASFRIELPV